jgi:hydrogenase maturation protein HypF
MPTEQTAQSAGELRRLRVSVRGAVQGVGFRPFIYRLAQELDLTGWVNNSAQGVFIEVEGPLPALERFLLRIESGKPPRSFIQSLESALLDPVGYGAFEVRHSDGTGAKTALVLPDIATCPDCLREICDPANRRYRYPFTNCTNCGPRFSIITALPYDRAQTSMGRFTMCLACQAEYENPLDRRFHAQPNACPHCGPQLALWDRSGAVLAQCDAALLEAAAAIRRGEIVALKGLGGFQLLADARNDGALRRLRQRKVREEKPFALMYPALDQVRAHCSLDARETRLLLSPEAPIVLLRRLPGADVAPGVAPGNLYLGIMLPYTPLHHLLLAELGFPVVATSGNRSDEPICIDEYEALERLSGIADLFLVHNRPIVRHVDDSIARVLLGRELVLRRARGYAPLPVELQVHRPLPPASRSLGLHGETTDASPPAILAVGAHLKNTVALGLGPQVFVSQHIGDLETAPACQAHHKVIAGFQQLYEVMPALVACDEHPDYHSTCVAEQLAGELALPLVRVQHHYAHVLACMAENELSGPLLGVSWDGTGYGLDGTIWGGEFLQVSEGGWKRAAYLRPFGLPGGEQAVREPRRAALGLLYEFLGDELFALDELAPLQTFSPGERAIMQTMLRRNLNTPRTSSAGRLFDALTSLVGLRQRSGFEGQAAMELEFALEGHTTARSYPFQLCERWHGLIVDWEPLLRGVLDDLCRHVSPGEIAAVFHNTLAAIVVAVAQRIGEQRVVLTGGCFQNAALTERTVQRLRKAGLRPYWHQRIPPNDGGIALGQAVAAQMYIHHSAATWGGVVGGVDAALQG